MRKVSSRFIQVVDALNEHAKIFGFIIVIIALVATYEVVARYVFVSPTKWAWGVNEQLLSALVIMGGGYALLHESHVRADLLYRRWSTKRKAIVDLCTSFLPLLFLGVLMYGAGELAWKSLMTFEHVSAYFAPPLYPLRVLVAIGVFMLLIQVLANFMRNLLTITSKG